MQAYLNNIITLLKSDAVFQNMEVFSEYPQNQKYSSYPCVTISAVKAEVSDAGLGNVVYSTSDSYVTGSTEIIDITIKIYAHVETGGSYISDLIDSAIDILLSDTNLSIASISTGSVQYNSTSEILSQSISARCFNLLQSGGGNNA
ncbi:MAG TPA: hypothetical protein H9675_02720 [Firmicutes bacterium]|mgnify:FL=1|nr:hypothetical protein [Bacillota bacterium]